MRVKFYSQKILGFLLVILVFSCTQKPARIVDNKNKTYQKKTSSRTSYQRANLRTSQNDEIQERDLEETRIEEPRVTETEISTPKIESQKNQVTVAAGETLYAISRKTGVSLSDLIKSNNLTPPYNLKVGDRLNVPSPNYHIVKSGETLYAISRLYQMKIDQLVEMNNLKAPYAVKVGDKIRISNFSAPQDEPVTEEKEDTKESGFVPIGKLADKNNRFSWPLKGELISKFGPKSGGLYNDGINIKAKNGAEVKASEDGAVAYVGNELKGYGNLVIVKHSGGWITAYAHLEKTFVKRGEKVEKGQKIATVGSSGNVNSPQLYFGLRKGRDAVNPQNYLR